MTTINATFDIPEGQDPEEFMYRLEELGIEFAEYSPEEPPAPAPKTRYNIEVLADETSYPEFAGKVREALAAAGMDFDGGYYAPKNEQPATWVGNPYLDEEGYDRLQGEHAILSVGRGITRNDVAVKGGPVRLQVGEYKSQLFRDPTWADVVRAVDVSVAVTNDFHHIFVEGVSPAKSSDGERIYEIVLGS